MALEDQDRVAKFSSHAEYYALAHACDETRWIQILMEQVDQSTTHKPIPIYMDNQNAMALAQKPKFNKTLKHMRVQYRIARECIEKDEIQLYYIPTEDMAADYLTKAVNTNKHEKCVEPSGLVKCN